MRPFIKWFQEPSSCWALHAPVPLSLEAGLLSAASARGGSWDSEGFCYFSDSIRAKPHSGSSTHVLRGDSELSLWSFVPDSICAGDLYTRWGTGLTFKDKSGPFLEIVARRRRRCDVAGSGIVGTLGVGVTGKFDPISNKCWVRAVLLLTCHKSFKKILILVKPLWLGSLGRDVFVLSYASNWARAERQSTCSHCPRARVFEVLGLICWLGVPGSYC